MLFFNFQRPLNDNDLVNVCNFLKEEEWIRTLAGHLQVPNSTVDKSLKNSKENSKSAYAILHHWRRTVQDPIEAWLKLYEALLKSGMEHLAVIVLQQRGQNLLFCFNNGFCRFAGVIRYHCSYFYVMSRVLQDLSKSQLTIQTNQTKDLSSVIRKPWVHL